MVEALAPEVSIVIPVYNGGDFLAQAIDSALAQTYKNIEILVINDGSEDAGVTERIALSYGDLIRYRKKPNGGVASALNMAIGEMSGEYFSWLSHDDLYLREKVERQIEALSFMPPSDKACTILYSNHEVFTTDPDKGIPVLLRGVRPEDFRYWITTENLLHGCTLLIPKSAFVEVGTFNELLQTTQDYDLWFQMARKYRFIHVPECLVKARSHSAQGSISMSKLAMTECNTLLSGFVMDLTKEELISSTQQHPVMAYARIAESMWYRSFLGAGWTAIRHSLKMFPKSSFHSNVLALCILIKAGVMYSVMAPLRKSIPRSFRMRLRRLLGSARLDDLQVQDSVPSLDLKDKFTEVYDKNIFGGYASRSGEGSNLIQTAIVRRELPVLMRELGIKTFLDAPCGDWYWMKAVDLPVERYIGLDIVEALVVKNQKLFGSDKVSFQCINLAVGELPKADLVLSRDCLVHLSFSDSLKIIANLKRTGAKYLLATTFNERTRNEDLGDGFWRPLNMQWAPFNFPRPVRLINEGCTEGGSLFKDKCLGLWLLQEIDLPESV